MKEIKFDFDSQAVQHLTQVDERLACLISTIGPYHLILREDYYESLINSILGQQLSASVAKVIRTRLLNICGELKPITLLNCPDKDLREIGISTPKIAYIKNLSLSILNGQLEIQSLDNLPDIEIINQLTKIKGIGRWTAEMFLIFSLGRLNVLSINDVGIQRGIKWLYQLENNPDELVLKKYGAAWSPYCTIASLYLWEVINQKLISKSANDFKMPVNRCH